MPLPFGDQHAVEKVAEIRRRFLVVASIRLMEMTAQMTGSAAVTYKRIGRWRKGPSEPL